MWGFGVRVLPYCPFANQVGLLSLVSLVCCDYFLLCGFLPVLVLVSFLPLSLYAGRVGEGKGSLSVTASGGQFLFSR
jgi:hypothetical protein